MADKFYTQDGALQGSVSYVLTMPATQWFIRQIGDLLRDVTLPDRWVQVGSVSVDDAVAAGTAMYLGFVPMIGQVIPYVTASPPDNCLICDGSTYARLDYPDLYAKLASVFIIDADHFVVPDLRGRTIIGMNTSYPMGSAGGEVTHQLTEAELASHAHAYDPVVVVDVDLEDLGLPQGNAAQIVPLATENTYATGGNQAHNNMQPYLALQYAIVAR